MQYLSQERIRLLQQKQDADARVAALQPQATQLEQLRQQRAALTPTWQQKLAAVAQCQAELGAAQQKVADIQQSIDDLRSEPLADTPLEPGTRPPRPRPVNRVLLDRLTKQLNQARVEANAAQSRLDQAQAQLAPMQADVQRLDGAIAAIVGTGLEQQWPLAQAAAAEASGVLAVLDADLAELSRDPLDRPALEQAAARWSERAAVLDLQVFDLDAQAQEMGRTRTALSAEKAVLEASLVTAVAELNAAEAALADAEASYNELLDELNNIPDGGVVP